MGGTQQKQAQPVFGLKAHPHDDRRQIRVGDDLLFKPVAPLPILLDHSIAQSVVIQGLDIRDHMTPLVVEEGGPIAHQELQITHLRPVESWPVDLSEDTRRDGEPHVRGARMGGPDCVLGGPGPARLDAGTTRGRIQAVIMDVVPHLL